MTVQLYVESNLFVLPFKVNVELVPKEFVLAPFVQLYVNGVVTTPLTLNVTANVAVPASQLIVVGVMVTTASGPVGPVAPV